MISEKRWNFPCVDRLKPALQTGSAPSPLLNARARTNCPQFPAAVYRSRHIADLRSTRATSTGNPREAPATLRAPDLDRDPVRKWPIASAQMWPLPCFVGVP